MPNIFKSHFPTEGLFPEQPPPQKINPKHLANASRRRNDQVMREFLSSVDEAPDFHNPYSDLNLFLSQKIKQEMRHHGSAKKWSIKIQEELLQKILPDFQKRFPHYRLGLSALKKTWEKISYYLNQIQDQKEAITQDGKLNVHFFIKENLRQCEQLKPHYSLPPYHFAHQLATKMSECIATVDGIRPKLGQLIKTIWAVQRHLLPNLSPDEFKSPYDEYDTNDKLIVKTILNITAQEPQVSQKELEYRVKKSITSSHHSDIESKIYIWTIQGDMLCRCIQVDHTTALFKLISEKWSAAFREIINHKEFVGSIYAEYGKLDQETYTQIWILYKYMWYTLFARPEESSFQRFIKWHQYELLSEHPHLDKENMLSKLEELCKNSLPLIPFDPSHVA